MLETAREGLVEHALSIGLGLGLAAAAGFRVFVPLLVMSVAGYSGHLELGQGFHWIGTLPAMVAFSTATALEIGAYYIPWLDNLLDGISGPAAVVAGSIVAASTFTEMDPLLRWSLAIIGGGGLAGIVKGTTTVTRGASTATTGGLANWMLSSFELGASFMLSMFAILLPLVTMAFVAALAIIAVKKLASWFGRSQEA
jgi:hypothetical protein